MELLGSLLPIIAIFAIFYLLIIRPAKKRQQDVARMQREVTVGTEVATSGGIFGTVVREVGDDKVALEVAPGVVVTVARQAVAGVVAAAPETDPSGSTDVASDVSADPADERGDDDRA